MIDFVIYYEHENRELESCILLKQVLENHGYNGLVVKTNSFRANLYRTLIIPRIIFVPYCYTEELLFGFTPYFRSKARVIDLQLEQIFSNSWNATGWYNPSGKAKQALHICWGTETYQRLLDSGIEPKNAAITGAIHFDFLKSPLKKIYKSRYQIAKEFNLPIDKKWIIYISSFSYSNLKGSMTIDKLKSSLKGNPNANIQMCDEYIDKQVEFSQLSKMETLAWFEELLDKSKDLIIIYRPHPAEDGYCEEVVRLSASHPRSFFCISAYSIRQWIVCSDLLLTWYSTSIIEALIVRKPCEIIRPLPFPEDMDSVLFKNCKSINNYRAFEQVCLRDPIFDVDNFPIDLSTFERYYLFNEREFSVCKICGIFKRMYSDKKKYEIIQPIRAKDGVKKVFQYLIYFFYYYTRWNWYKKLFEHFMVWFDADEERRIESLSLQTERTLRSIIKGTYCGNNPNNIKRRKRRARYI